MSNTLNSLSRGVLQRCLVAAIAVAAVFALAGPARADVTEVMREIQRVGSARVIITMQTGLHGHARWSKAQSVAEQQATVAATGAVLAQRLKDAQIPLTRQYATLPYAAAVVNSDQLQRLASMPEVASVRLVQIQKKLPVASAVQHPAGGVLTSLATTVASIGAPTAWAAGYEGAGLTVAVIDGGFNVNNPLLSGKNVGDACFADTGAPLTAECPSGQTPEIGTGAASNCPQNNNPNELERCDHGSNVASIAVGNDGTNFGVARKANFMPIDVYSSDSDKSDCDPDPTPCEVTDDIALLDALDYVNQNAATYNVAAVNISSGGGAYSGYCDDNPDKVGIDNLRAKGIAVTIASGNDSFTGQVEELACVSSAEATGATDASTNVASFSDFATMVDLMAPGEVSETEGIDGAAGTGSGTIALSGTSMAAPHAAGAWTLMRSAFPNATADQIDQALKTTGIPVTRSGAGFSVPKIQVMQAISYFGGHSRLLFNQIISSNASTYGLSFLRVYNNTSAGGTVTFTIRDTVTGVALGTWTSPTIAAGASPQYSISTLEQNAAVAQGQTVVQSGRSYYNLEAASTFGGYVQYIAWSPNVGLLGNLTSCPAGLSSDGTTLLNVDAASAAQYVSHLRIVNTGSAASTATLTFNAPADGHQIAQWTSGSIPPGGTLDVTEPSIEAQVSALSSATNAGASQYNVVLAAFAGYVQHVIENRQLEVFTDMSAKCAISASQ